MAIIEIRCIVLMLKKVINKVRMQKVEKERKKMSKCQKGRKTVFIKNLF